MPHNPLPKSVCVYCGSRPGNDPAFTADAEALGAGLANAGLRLVYGAGDVGLMGSVARAAQLAGGQTLGVIPQHLVAWEVGKTDLTTYVVTETMHERKKVMFMNCDAVVVLPGGAGSLDELFEVLTWRPARSTPKARFPCEYKRLLGPPHATYKACRGQWLCRGDPARLRDAGCRCGLGACGIAQRGGVTCKGPHRVGAVLLA